MLGVRAPDAVEPFLPLRRAPCLYHNRVQTHPLQTRKNAAHTPGNVWLQAVYIRYPRRFA